MRIVKWLVRQGYTWMVLGMTVAASYATGTRPALRVPSLDFTDRLDNKVAKTIKRHRPRTRRQRSAAAEAEQLTIHSA